MSNDVELEGPMLRENNMNGFFVTEDVDHTGGCGSSMLVLHLDCEDPMVGPDGVSDHQGRLALLGGFQTQTLPHRGHRLLTRLWNLQAEGLVVRGRRQCKLKTLHHVIMEKRRPWLCSSS